MLAHQHGGDRERRAVVCGIRETVSRQGPVALPVPIFTSFHWRTFSPAVSVAGPLTALAMRSTGELAVWTS